MNARSLTLNAVRVVAAALALAILVLMPAVIRGANGLSFEPIGIAIDLAAVIALIAVAWSVLAPRIRNDG